ncbi:tyrosine-type recombinase/integrase [Bailinhaonella thermotolerans]|uniref:Integrase n=1 Tax=Bailinhaonella thermotolerans TaxID=1070861 RepID=A0A3A4B9R6_9ACTN|nr:tyrosine-type recombinase/integrase [Bailinhaonella thermotolerans]RJL35303.1 integrase [Bailinhaonella thermotolerans]
MRPAELNRITVADAVARYVELLRARVLTGAIAASTAEVYARDMATFAAFAGPGRVLDDLTGEDVDAVLLAFARKPDERRREAAPAPAGRPVQSAASQARFRRSVSAMFKHATLAGWVQVNPMTTAVVVPRQRGGLRPERRALTMEQARGVIEAAEHLATSPPSDQPGPGGRRRRRDQRTELRDALVVLLLTTVGARVSELTRANVEDFHTDRGVRYWRIFGKGGRTRDVPLPAGVAQVLDLYLQTSRRELLANGDGAGGKALLLSWRGRRLARQDVQAVIDRVQRHVDPANRREVTPHGLRHTVATHLLADHTDMDAVRRVLGHQDLSTLGHYRDQLPGELEAAMNAHPLLRLPRP